VSAYQRLVAAARAYDALDEARRLLARIAETEAAVQPALESCDPDALYPALRDRNAALGHLEYEAPRLLAALCDELASLRALVIDYANVHEARVAHSTQLVRDEHWYAERDDLNNVVSDALTALRKAAK